MSPALPGDVDVNRCSKPSGGETCEEMTKSRCGGLRCATHQSAIQTGRFAGTGNPPPSSPFGRTLYNDP